MTKQKQKIIDYAKELYTSYNADGTKIYSLNNISAQIQQKFSKKIHSTTVLNWAKKYDWNKINEKIKQQSIQKAKEDKFSVDEKIVEKESDLLAEIYKYAEQGMKIGYREIFEIFKENGNPVSDTQIRDLMTLVKMNTEFIFRINDIPESIKIITSLTPDERAEKIKRLEQLQRIK